MDYKQAGDTRTDFNCEDFLQEASMNEQKRKLQNKLLALEEDMKELQTKLAFEKELLNEDRLKLVPVQVGERGLDYHLAACPIVKAVSQCTTYNSNVPNNCLIHGDRGVQNKINPYTLPATVQPSPQTLTPRIPPPPQIRDVPCNSHDYMEKLMELDRLCKEEMKSINETSKKLEPLNQIASDWSVAQYGRPIQFPRSNLPISDFSQTPTSIEQDEQIKAIVTQSRIMFHDSSTNLVGIQDVVSSTMTTSTVVNKLDHGDW